ncbi:UvrD-helicase domain-containing protein [Vibrio parahaemolyticus]|uniref:UvrD-helicase domain-containing protein n=1 Tax=Vibrio cidicii TaxID=1763883 RepID=UPI003AF9C767
MIDTWVPKDGLTFDDKSLEIIQSNANLAVWAGPGAGKTEILAQKACFLLETELCEWPFSILSISRKREAASNLKERVQLRCGNELSERFHSFTIEAFTKSIVDRFMCVLPKHRQPSSDYEITSGSSNFPKSLNFDHITSIALEICNSSSDLMASLRVAYKYVFIDEFQDLNGVQYEFVKTLFCNTESVVTVVGDSKQAIMKFAKALPDGFYRFERDFNAELKVIYSNFRATPELKTYLNCLGSLWWPINDKSSSPQTQTIALNPNDYAILVYHDEEQEAEQLALRIAQWVNEDGIKPDDIAVLFRINTNNNYGYHISNALLKCGVLSFDETAMQDHLSEPLGKIVVSFLKLLTRTRDIPSWECLRDLYLYSHPKCGRHEDYELSTLLYYISNVRDNMQDKAFGVEHIREVTNQFIDEFFCEYLGHAWSQYGHKVFVTETINGVLSELEKARLKTASWADAVDLISGVNAVRMMTIHKSKGAEFEAVILLGFEDFPFFRFGMSHSKLDEERSSVFVALSRAKSRLLVSSAKRRQHTGPSSYAHIRNIMDDMVKLGMVGQRVTIPE